MEGIAIARKSSKQKGSIADRKLTVAINGSLLTDIQSLIRETKERVAQAVNSTLVMLYWEIGRRIHTEILKAQRADYGEAVIPTLATALTSEFGDGFSRPNLFRMVRFAEMFPDHRIVSTLSRQLGWSHFVEINPINDPLKREFYAELCRVERWSVRTLRAKIQGMLFERTALSKKPEALAKQELSKLRQNDLLSADLVFRDPYLLHFLGLKGAYTEADLESAILREIEQFMLELGTGFCFVARQKRIVIDGEDYYLDLLFYHRILRRLVAVELKLGKLQAGDKGQMELYLRWLEKHEMQPGEERPLGLILCSDKKAEQIELLQLDKSGIRVATYLTELPPRPVLEKRLHQAVSFAQSQISKVNNRKDP